MIDKDIKKPDMAEIGVTGLERYSGYVYEEFIHKLRHEQGIKTYDQMSSNDSVIGAILFAVQMLIRQVDWAVDYEEGAVKDFVVDCMGDMTNSWEEIITEILSFLEFGWSWHEIVYKKRSDGKIGWKNISGRAQTSWHEWKFADNGDILAMIQRAAPDFKSREIPLPKSLLFRTTIAKNNPEGKSILRTAYRSWYFKKHIEQIQGVGIERDLAGLPVASVPPEILSSKASDSDKAILAQIKKIVTNIRRDEQEGVVFPSSYDENGNKLYDLTLMSTGGSRQFNTKEILEYYDQRIAMTILADFVLLGHGRTGSFALATSKTKLFTFAISAFVDIIASVFNRKAIPDLLNLNGIVLDKYPKITASEVEDVNLNDLGNLINRLAGAGATIFPDEDLENDIRRKANLPPKNLSGDPLPKTGDPK
jgi:hypothetical protein